jgi:hypothetical protein
MDAEANPVVFVSAAEGLGQREGIFLHRFHCIQDLVAQAGWELAEGAAGAGQDFNGPVCGWGHGRILGALWREGRAPPS